MLFPRTIGSSPRMRGTRYLLHIDCRDHRFIPAHAGNTLASTVTVWPFAVHPRACGEHSLCTVGACGSSGSSPRMRGTLLADYLGGLRYRFIPAHAGNTLIAISFALAYPVHPRACGEHAAARPLVKWLNGSSPRMRGTLIAQVPHLSNRRFIPAHAGNTLRCHGRLVMLSVHPRACGEHGWRRPGGTPPPGSSPRMRGTLTRPAAGDGGLRFIPAHAGNTCAGLSENKGYSVHPRACGEHNNLKEPCVGRTGSSPRMRGTHNLEGLVAVIKRFIPAHAGNTCRARTPAPTPPVHPRACGEHSNAARAEL